jgi:hypothetical protein
MMDLRGRVISEAISNSGFDSHQDGRKGEK